MLRALPIELPPVPKERFELSQAFAHMLLRHACLPVPPFGQIITNKIVTNKIVTNYFVSYNFGCGKVWNRTIIGTCCEYFFGQNIYSILLSMPFP